MFYTIYTLVGAVVWLIVGPLIAWLSTLEFGGWVSTLAPRQGLTGLICLAGYGATVGLVQATSMAYGGRVRSPLFMAVIPSVLGAVAGAFLGTAGIEWVGSFLPLRGFTSMGTRLVGGGVLGLIAAFSITAFSAFVRFKMGMRGPMR